MTGTAPADLLAEYCAAQRAAETYRAYRSDWRGWLAWLRHRERRWQSAGDEDLAVYLALKARAGIRPSTLSRIAIGISAGYEERGVAPVRGPHTKAVFRGIRRTHGTTAKRAKPITIPLLRKLVDGIRRRNQRGRDRRDRALILLMWQGALRRGEAVGLDWRDVRHVAGGVMILVRRSKGARDGEAVEIPIVEASDPRYCPLRALEAWRTLRPDHDEEVFSASTGAGRWTGRMSPQAVNMILRSRLDAAGIDPNGYSTHSLRAGLLTSAALAGTTAWRLREHSRHKRSETLDLYVRDARLIASHPALGLV